MAFKIQGNLINLNFVLTPWSAVLLDFMDTIYPYGIGMCDTLSPTDSQAFLRREKVIPVLDSSFTAKGSAVSHCGLTLRGYCLGKLCSCASMHAYCSTRCGSTMTYYSRCIFDSYMCDTNGVRSYFLRYFGYSSDGCLFKICVG